MARKARRRRRRHSSLDKIREKIISDSKLNRLNNNPKFRILRRRRKEIIIVSVVAIFFLFTLSHSEKTMMLTSTQQVTETEAQSYIFTDSDYVDLKTSSDINYDVEEGQKVGANTKLSKTYKIETNKYIDEAIDVVNWRLKHKSYKKRDSYFNELAKLDDEVDAAEDSYGMVKTSNDTNKVKDAKEKLDELKKEQNYMRKSIRYIFSDNATLKRVKKELESRKKKKNKNLTISNLNFSFTGYIYFSRTGFEDVLNTNVLGSIGKKYFEYLDSFKPEDTGDDQTIIKIVNNDCAYVCAILDKDTYVQGEDTAKELHKQVKKNHKLKTEDDYYDFLIRRVDSLITYPAIKFKDDDDNENNGYIVNSIKYGNDKKILVICLKDAFDNLINIDRGDITLETDTINVYEIPKSALISKDDKDYVYALTSGNFKELVEVKVYEKTLRKVLLKTSENTKLEENMEIVTNPN